MTINEDRPNLGRAELPTFVLARTPSRRPTLQHVFVLNEDGREASACGLDLTQWSRAYQPAPIRAILCMKCARITLDGGLS